MLTTTEISPLERLRADRSANDQWDPLLCALNLPDSGTLKEKANSLIFAEKLVYPEIPVDSYHRAIRATIYHIVQAVQNSQNIILEADNPSLPKERQSKLPLNKVRRYESLPAQRKSNNLGKLVKEMLSNTKFGKYGGYDWKATHHADQKIRTVQLVDVIRANLMLLDPSLDIVLNNYFVQKSERKLYRQGANAVVSNIPSISQEVDSHGVTLFRIPTYNSRNDLNNPKFAESSFNLDSRHACGKDIPPDMVFSRHYQTTAGQRSTPELLLDHHVVLAYEYVRQYMVDDPNHIVLPIFPTPGEEITNLFWFLYENTLKKDGSVFEPLLLKEIENLLHNFIAYRNYSSSSSGP